MREVSGGVSDESARTSLKRGASPSRLAVLEMGRDSRLAAKEREAAMERSPPCDKCGNTRSALGEQPEEVSSFGTPDHLFQDQGQLCRRHRRASANSGKVRSWARRASAQADVAVLPRLRRGTTAEVSGDTSVLPTASCEPPHNGKPLAITSMLHSSCLDAWRFRSHQDVLWRLEHQPHGRPEQLHVQAVHPVKTPDRGQAATWSPKAPSGRPQRHRAGAGGRGNRDLKERRVEGELRSNRANSGECHKAQTPTNIPGVRHGTPVPLGSSWHRSGGPLGT
eukprot:s2299_g4.t1